MKKEAWNTMVKRREIEKKRKPISKIVKNIKSLFPSLRIQLC